MSSPLKSTVPAVGRAVEEGRLAGTVGADDRVEGPFFDRDADVIDRHERSELAAQVSGFENRLVHGSLLSP